MELGICYKVTDGVTREICEKYSLSAEAAYRGFEAACEEVPDLVTSVHLPWNDSDLGRLNYAGPDGEYRRAVLARIRGVIEEAAGHFPNVERAIMHGAPKRWDDHFEADARVGDYEVFVATLRELADFAGDHGMVLTLENNNAYWRNDAGQLDVENGRLQPDADYFGCSVDEWLQAYDDVAHENLKLTLDTAHACTWAHSIEDHAERTQALLRYLSRPEAIAEVHWNGHLAFEIEGRTDQHMTLGTGSIPIEMHRGVKALECMHLLEHFHGEDALIEELAFIESL